MTQANRPMGLFHTEADLQLARSNRQREPIRGALARLEKPDADPLIAAHLSALRGQLHDDLEAGAQAADAINQTSLFTSDDLDGMKRALGWLTVAAMLRHHPAWQPAWRTETAAGLKRLSEGDDRLRQLWLGALTLAAGILRENADDIERGAATYRQTVDQWIHPEGYLKGIADLADAPGRYEAQVSGVCALVLLAEMAGRAALDLWNYDSRAVSVITAVTYTHYYYFFPEKWRWEAGLSRERTAEVMRREGAFMELVNRRAPPQGIEHFLAEQRPLFCVWGGGLTTLTHSLKPEKKRRWRLW